MKLNNSMKWTSLSKAANISHRQSVIEVMITFKMMRIHLWRLQREHQQNVSHYRSSHHHRYTILCNGLTVSGWCYKTAYALLPTCCAACLLLLRRPAWQPETFSHKSNNLCGTRLYTEIIIIITLCVPTWPTYVTVHCWFNAKKHKHDYLLQLGMMTSSPVCTQKKKKKVCTGAKQKSSY